MARIMVRGSDFTGYRIAGAIAAALLGIALVWQILELFDGDAQTLPQTRWGVAMLDGQSAGDEGFESGLLANEILAARTRLQRDRQVSGPAPEDEVPEVALGQGEFLIEEPMEGGEDVVRAWALADEDTIAMLRQRDRVVGLSSLPYVNADVFERPAGRTWRRGQEDVATHVGAIAILGTAFLLAAFLAIRGRVPIVHGQSGRTIKRFNFLERGNHWMTAASFIGLALTGVVIAFGETLILPLFGEPTLGWLGWLSTWGHMMFAPPFFIGICVMAAIWTIGNLPSRLDIPWLARFGGFFSDSGDHPSARRFNAGQKLSFWAATLGGLVMVVTGVTLMFPYFWVGLELMSWVMVIHAVVGLLLIAFFIGHIYIGTVGMQDAFWAMWTGDVDWNWAAEHHDLWLAELTGGENKPLPPSEETKPSARPGPRRRAAEA